MKHIGITAYEGCRVDLSSAVNGRKARDHIMHATSHLSDSPFRINRRGELYATKYVGLIHAAPFSIEILPKLALHSKQSEDADFLRRLLTASGLVPQRLVMNADVDTAAIPVLEIVIRSIASHMIQGLHREGVPRRNEERVEYTETISGVIDMGLLVRLLPTEQNRIPVRHVPSVSDNSLTRMLLALVMLLSEITTSRQSKAMLRAAEGRLADVRMLNLTAEAVKAVSLRPSENYWAPELRLAQTLTQGTSPDPMTAGSGAGVALIFSLHDVFERVIRRSLSRILPPTEWSIRPRTVANHYLRAATTNKDYLRLRPDILLRRSADSTFRVADAKWKHVRAGGQTKLQAADVYQLSAYMHKYEVNRGCLIVPTQQSEGEPPMWSETFNIVGSTRTIEIVGIDLPGLLSSDASRSQSALNHLSTAVLAR